MEENQEIQSVKTILKFSKFWKLIGVILSIAILVVLVIFFFEDEPKKQVEIPVLEEKEISENLLEKVEGTEEIKAETLGKIKKGISQINSTLEVLEVSSTLAIIQEVNDGGRILSKKLKFAFVAPASGTLGVDISSLKRESGDSVRLEISKENKKILYLTLKEPFVVRNPIDYTRLKLVHKKLKWKWTSYSDEDIYEKQEEAKRKAKEKLVERNNSIDYKKMAKSQAELVLKMIFKNLGLDDVVINWEDEKETENLLSEPNK